jgi:hypothetical protein
MTWCLRLSCECGREITVTAGSADVALPCTCGRTIKVPPFRKPPALVAPRFEAHAYDVESTERLVLQIIAAYVLGCVFLGGALMSLTSAPLWVAGVMVALAGRMWLLLLIISECHPEAVVWFLLVPFFTWYFAYERWDIAKWAFVCNLGGWVLFIGPLLGMI